MPAPCVLKQSLTEMLDQAKTLYAAALSDLSLSMGKSSQHEAQRLIELVKRRREMQAEAQALLDEHVLGHKCE
jgi:uncharacterized protein (DUF3084 family)